MAATYETKPIIDGTGASFDQRVVNDGSVGTGVYMPATVQARFDGAVPRSEWHYAAPSGGLAISSAASATLVAAAGSGLRNYLRSLDLKTSALTTATEIVIRDGAGGTVLWRSKIETAGVLNPASITFEPPLKSTANTLLEVATLTAAGASTLLYVNAHGFVAA